MTDVQQTLGGAALWPALSVGCPGNLGGSALGSELQYVSSLLGTELQGVTVSGGIKTLALN